MLKKACSLNLPTAACNCNCSRLSNLLRFFLRAGTMGTSGRDVCSTCPDLTWKLCKGNQEMKQMEQKHKCSTYLVQHSSPIVLEPHLDLSVSLTLALTITKRNNNLMLNFEGTPVLPDTSQSMPGRVSVTRWGRSFTSSPLAFAAPASSIVEYDRINDRIV